MGSDRVESRYYSPRCAPVAPYMGQAGKMNATSGVGDMVGGRRPVVRRSGAVGNQLRLLRHAFVSARYRESPITTRRWRRWRGGGCLGEKLQI